jgi:3',5'-cyclic AMP phosphodiesterase CpdA
MISKVMRTVLLTVASAVCFVLLLAAQNQPAPPFFFVQMSDPQFGMFTADKDFAQETLNFELAIATANRWRPAFVVITGDLVNKPGDARQIAEFQRITARLDRSIPLYNVPGNHDVENAPTSASIAAYVRTFGPDHYAFRAQSVYGIVLDSTVIAAPGGVRAEYDAQDRWLSDELARARGSGARHVVVFQHHPWFLNAADEPDGYFNIPLARRTDLLARFKAGGVRYLISGHYHRNAVARDGDIEMITSGPVGMPLGQNTQSGLRVVIVRDTGFEHRFYALGELPNAIDLKAGAGR